MEIFIEIDVFNNDYLELSPTLLRQIRILIAETFSDADFGIILCDKDMNAEKKLIFFAACAKPVKDIYVVPGENGSIDKCYLLQAFQFKYPIERKEGDFTKLITECFPNLIYKIKSELFLNCVINTTYLIPKK